MRQPMSPDYSKTYVAGGRRGSKASVGHGSRRSSKKSFGSKKSSGSRKSGRKSSHGSQRSNGSRKSSRRSLVSRKSSGSKKINSQRSSAGKRSNGSKKSSKRGSRTPSRRSSYVRSSNSQRRSSAVQRYGSQRRSSDTRDLYRRKSSSRKQSGSRKPSEAKRSSAGNRSLGSQRRYPEERRASVGSRKSSKRSGGSQPCSTNNRQQSRRCSSGDKGSKPRSRRSSEAGSREGSRRSSKGSGFQKLSFADLARKVESKSPWGSRRESLNRIVDSKMKFYEERERKNFESNLPVAQRQALKKRKRPQKEVFRNPKPRKRYDTVCCNCQLKIARNQCVYTTRKSICQNCGPKKAPKLMYLIKRAISGRLYGANVKEMAHFIRSRYGNQVPNQGMQIRIKCAITRMIALHYIQKNPKDYGRYILTPQGRLMKLQKPKLPRLPPEFYKDIRKEKWRSKHRFLRQHTR